MPKHILKDQKACKRLRINYFDAFIYYIYVMQSIARKSNAK